MQSLSLCNRWQLEQTGRSPLHFIFRFRQGSQARGILRRLCFVRACMLALSGPAAIAAEDCVGIVMGGIPGD